MKQSIFTFTYGSGFGVSRLAVYADTLAEAIESFKSQITPGSMDSQTIVDRYIERIDRVDSPSEIKQ